MMRFALLLALLAAGLTAVPAGAQAPAAHAVPTTAAVQRKVPVHGNLVNPGNRRSSPPPMSGQGCISGSTASRAGNTVNPVTGKPQAAPIVQIPLGKNAEGVKSATTRAQQTQACAHAH